MLLRRHRQTALRWLAVLGIFAIVLAGLVRVLSHGLESTKSMVVELAQIGASRGPLDGGRYYVDLSGYRALGSPEAFLALFEDGTAARRVDSSDAVAGQPGSFAFSGSTLIFRPLRDGDPFAPGRMTLAFGKSPSIGAPPSRFARGWAVAATCVAILINAVVAFAMLRGERPLPPLGHGVALFLALAVVLAVQLAPRWHIYWVAPDTAGYLLPPDHNPIRTPPYPAFARFFGGGDEALKSQWSLPRGVYIQGTTDSHLLRIAQAQKVVLAGSILVLSIAMSSLVPAPLAAAFGLAGSYADNISPTISVGSPTLLTFIWLGFGGIAVVGLFLRPTLRARWRIWALTWAAAPLAWVVGISLSHMGVFTDAEALLSEPLTQVLQSLTAAAMLMALAHRQYANRWLIACALCAGATLSVRVAAIYVLALPAAPALLMLHAGFRRNAPRVFLAVVCCAIVTVAPKILRVAADWPPQREQLYWQLIAFAIEATQPGDELLFQDEEQRDFVRRVIPARLESMKLSGGSFANQLDINLNIVAFATASSVLKDHGRDVSGKAIDTLFAQVSVPILKAHPEGYLRILRYNIDVGLGSWTRLSSYFHPLAIFGALLVAAVAMGGASGWGVFGLTASHLGNLALTTLLGIPIPRYVHLSEPLVYLAMVIVVARVFRELPYRSERERKLC